MKRIRVVLISWLIIGLLPVMLPAEDQQGLRAAYLHLADPGSAAAHLRLLHTHGVNAILAADAAYPLHADRWRAWSALAQQQGLQMFAVLNFAAPPPLRPLAEHFRPYVNRYGEVYPHTPCPLDAAYWQTVIGRRFQQLARLATTTPLAGLLFDTEMYGSEISIYGDPCLCDACWRAFVQATPELDNADLPAEQRLNVLGRQRLWARYHAFQQQQVQAILAQVAQQVHDVHPHLTLGFLGYVAQNWFYAGLIHGLGAPTRPALVFSESTYVRGCAANLPTETRPVERTGAARYVPGLWLARFFPSDLPVQLCECAARTAGYWLYTADSLWSPGARLHGRPDEYWAALQQAAETSGKAAGQPPECSLRTSFYDRSRRKLLRPESVQPILRRIAADTPGDDVSDSPIYRHKTLIHCLNTNGGMLKITRVAVGQPPDPDARRAIGPTDTPIRYTLFDPQGSIRRQGRITPQARAAGVFVAGNEPGVWSLLLESGRHGARVSCSGMPWMLEASTTFPLTMRGAAAYTFYTSPTSVQASCCASSERPELKLRAYCASGQSAWLTVQPAGRNVTYSYEIARFTEIRVPGPPPEAGRGTLRIAPAPAARFDDVRLSLYEAAYPYLLLGQVSSIPPF